MTLDTREARRRAVQWMRQHAATYTRVGRLDTLSLACDCEALVEGAPPLGWLEEAADIVADVLGLEVVS